MESLEGGHEYVVWVQMEMQLFFCGNVALKATEKAIEHLPVTCRRLKQLKKLKQTNKNMNSSTPRGDQHVTSPLKYPYIIQQTCNENNQTYQVLLS